MSKKFAKKQSQIYELWPFLAIFHMLMSSASSIELCTIMQIGRYKLFCHSHETPLFWIKNFKSDQSKISIEN